jgi:hypothetical protein
VSSQRVPVAPNIGAAMSMLALWRSSSDETSV